jgi:hypothetical protein
MLLLRIGSARERNDQNSNGKGASVEPGAHASMLFSAAAYSRDRETSALQRDPHDVPLEIRCRSDPVL